MIPLKDVIDRLSLNVIGGFPGGLQVSGIGSLQEATSDQISFAAGHRYAELLYSTKACAVIMDYDSLRADLPPEAKFAILDSKNPYLAFAKATQLFKAEEGIAEFDGGFFMDETASKGEGTVIFPGASIGSRSLLGERCRIMNNAFIGSNVVIGNNVRIYPNVTIYDNSRIGDNCIIHAGAVIGSDGFGFARDKTGYVKIIHSGYALIEDDVEIGANSTIDRGAVDFTRIGAGTKIDNLVQVAHNVIIGKNCVIAAQTGIAGSAKIGDNVTIGGQVGIAGHIAIGNNVMIAAQSGVSNSVKDNEVISGSPAFPIKEWRNSVVLFKKLPELYRKIKEISKK